MSALFSAFPGLAGDKHFKITSNRDPSYNCIAWSLIKDNINVWPHVKPLDGVDWPDGLPVSDSLEVFADLYRRIGYEICGSADFEEGFQKVAIYVKDGTTQCTHAARLRSDGYWTSKLGEEHDINHGDPSTLEGNQYGVVALIMKRKNVEFRSGNLKRK